MPRGKSQKSKTKTTAPAAEAPAVVEEAAVAEPTSRRLLQRFKIGGNVFLQIILGLIIFFQVNYLSCQRYHRWDLTQNRKFTLSDTTRNFLGQLDSDVSLVMAFLGSSELFDDVKGLISEYERNGGKRVTAEVLDLSRDRQRLAQLRDQQGLQFNRDSLVVMSRDRKKIIGAEELVTRDRRSGRIVEFKGEEVLTSALLELTEKQQKKIYLVVGKRQGDEFQQIARQLAELAAAQNTRLESVALEGAPSIPSDADAVILAGNQQPLTEREVEVLADFWHNEDDPEKRGALVILLDPDSKDEALHAFLRTHGVGPRDDRILSAANIPGLANRKITDFSVALLDSPGVAPQLVGMTLQLTGQTQSLAVEQDSDLLKMDNIHPRPLMLPARSFWGETEFRAESATFSENQDNAWPVFPAASVVRGSLGDPTLEELTSRMIVVGNPDVIDPRGNTAKVNADFLMSALNWTLDREEMAGISPRKPTSYVLAVDPAKLSLLHNVITYLLPLVALFIGGIVWYTRRA